MAFPNSYQTHVLPAPVTAPPPPAPHFQLPASPFAYFNPSQSFGPASQSQGGPTLTSEQQKKLAWKYKGYKEFSKWMASEDDFFVFRRFGRLNAGVVLWMQDRITQIETRLDEIHEMIANSPDIENRRNDSFRWDAKYEQERDHLMTQLSGLLHHYSMSPPESRRQKLTYLGR
jgi:hypothetical protein